LVHVGEGCLRVVLVLKAALALTFDRAVYHSLSWLDGDAGVRSLSLLLGAGHSSTDVRLVLHGA